MFIEVKDLSKSYQTGDVKTIALSNAALALDSGEIGVILGPSGSGKSTMMNILGGIDRPDSGSVKVADIEITQLNDSQLTEYRRNRIGFIFQSYNLIPHLTVAENIEVIENISSAPLNTQEVLAAVDLTEKQNNFPRELSGGQQQRVAIARALVKNPQLLLCDELTGALDYQSAVEVLTLIQAINRKYQTTILIITHNNAISIMANRVFRFRSGEVVETLINQQPADAQGIKW